MYGTVCGSCFSCVLCISIGYRDTTTQNWGKKHAHTLWAFVFLTFSFRKTLPFLYRDKRLLEGRAEVSR